MASRLQQKVSEVETVLSLPPSNQESGLSMWMTRLLSGHTHNHLWPPNPSVNRPHHGSGRIGTNPLPGCDGEEIGEYAKHHDLPKYNTHQSVPPLPLPTPSQDHLQCGQEPHQTTSSQCVWTLTHASCVQGESMTVAKYVGIKFGIRAGPLW